MSYVDILKNYQDLEYLEFHKKLVVSKYPFIGIRIPNIKKVAKEIQKIDGINSLNNFTNSYYEEIMARGFIIAWSKINYQEKVKLIDEQVKFIDNWALCDSFVSSIKYLDYEKYLKQIKKYLNSKDEYKLRFALVMLINKYMDHKYLDVIYSAIKDYKSDKYYYLMAKAWLLSVAFVFDFERTLTFVKNNDLDDFTFKKGLSKTIESFRITNEQKEILKELRSSKNEEN